ncbi:MAG: SDR family oxidoreductase [Pseudomonadota bacterium]
MTARDPRLTAVVTGGHVGIGHAVSRALAADGIRIAIGARRACDPAIQDKVRGTVAPDVFMHPLDVRSATSVSEFRSAVDAECGPVAILVNAAGISTHQTICAHDLADWTDVIETNLTGPFLTMRAFMPAMIDRGWGRIVNIASTAASTAVADHPAYCASKSGLLGLSRAAALEGAPHGVTCVTVSPTWVETDMLRQSAGIMARQSGRSVAEEIREIACANPQNRLVQAEEVAAVVAFACSDRAPALTMEDIVVSAGAHW